MGLSILLQPENREVARKLGMATGLMFTLPILAFYVSLYVFADKQYPENWAGGIAILVVNIVIGGYCYSALMEDDDDPNDARRPKTGSSKQRTD